MQPGCVQQPRLPFAVAATGPRGLKVAVQHGATWVTTGDRESRDGPLDADAGAAVVGRQIERLEAACADAGRDPASIDRLVLTGVELAAGLDTADSFAHTVGSYAAVGVTDLVVHWPRPNPPFAGDIDAFEAIVAAAR